MDDDLEIWFPSGVELLTDVSETRWVRPALKEPSYDPWSVANIVPSGFDAYVRIFHPLSGEDGDRPWSSLTERPLGPETALGELVEIDQAWLDRHEPEEGTLPERLCMTLVAVLREHTSTPEDCLFCMFDGFGMYYPQVEISIDHEPSPEEQRAITAWGIGESFRRSAEFARRTSHIQRFDIPSRDGFVFRGPVERVATLTPDEDWFQSPTMWWPSDRAWVVSTDIDDHSTYVGGTNATIEAIVEHPDIEAVPVPLAAKIPASPCR